jgi:hypothetical protein
VTQWLLRPRRESGFAWIMSLSPSSQHRPASPSLQWGSARTQPTAPLPAQCYPFSSQEMQRLCEVGKSRSGVWDRGFCSRASADRPARRQI